MKENIEKLSLSITLVVIIVASIADLFGLLDKLTWLAERIPTIILLLLASVVLYWMSEQKKERDKLDDIENLASLSSINAKKIETTEEAMAYLSQRFMEAKYTIDQAAIAPSLKPTSYKNYDEILTKVLKKNVVKYRHVVVLDQVRWKRVKEFLTAQGIGEYYVKYYDRISGNLPGLSFSIIDKNEIVMRYPYRPDQPGLWVSIKHPEIIQIFSEYFTTLWNNGKDLDSKNSQEIMQFDKLYID